MPAVPDPPAPVAGRHAIPAPATRDVPLPTSLAEALGQEYARVFHAPFETLLTVTFNAALMSSAWFFLPASLSDQLFELHGSLAFAFVLSSWMYSDVPATNVLAPDAVRVLAAIDQPKVLRRILEARRLVLWSVVAPVCLLISFLDGIGNSDKIVDVYSAVAIGIIPLGVLAISAWLGILLPYHPIPIRYRLAHRKDWWPMLVRWGSLVLVPYALVPALTVTLMSPSLLVWGLTSKSGLTTKVPDNDLGLGMALACGIAITAVYVGQRVSLHLIARRRDRLVAYLSDPRRG